ncbi:5-bromo-4-chloroindolyl phosphate hydrolysis family protein [Gammaproteobacteria bacterium]|nr:5-bromo-4-chloroindolyl phosphate hydrolysis family protein [Gammaproteobacteria bacterium]
MNQPSTYSTPRFARRLLTTPILMYVLGAPLVPATLFSLGVGKVTIALAGLSASALLLLATYLVQRGLKHEARARDRRWNRTNRQPWKLLGSLLAGVSVATVSYVMVGLPLLGGLLMGGLAALGVTLRYGRDLRFSEPDTVSRFGVSIDEIVEIVDEARHRVDTLEDAARRIRSTELSQRLRHIAGRGRDIIDEVEADPRDLRRTRKFLKVYLDGAMQVTEKYAERGQHAGDATLDSNFRNVLNTIEETFETQYAKLQIKDITDLDIQIEVLEKQMKHEGVI